MTILVWGIIIALAVLLCWSLWMAAEHTGRIKERNETLEKGIEDAKRVSEILASPTRSWDDVRASLRERKPK